MVTAENLRIMETRLLFSGIVALLFGMVACQKEENVKEQIGEVTATGKTYTAVIEQVDDTKSAVDIDGETGRFVWVASDPISIIAKNSESTYEDYRTTITDVADGKGSFSLSADYSAPTFAVYPHIIAVEEGFDENGMLKKVSLPAFYGDKSTVYKESTNAAMYAEFSEAGVEDDTEELVFKHLAGVLMIQFTNVPAGVNSMIFTVPGKNITGDFEIADWDTTPVINLSDGTNSTVTFRFKALESVQDLTFYIPLPVGTYPEFKAELRKSGATLFEQKATKSRTLERKELKALNAVEYYKTELVGLSAGGAANCYVVSAAGSYSFNTVKGNSLSSVGEVKSAKVLWENTGEPTAPEVGHLVKDVTYNDGVIGFTATENEGNAVIAAYDGENGEGNILWSWHIWLTDTPKDQVYNNNAGTMMDRNLGATSATPTDGALTYGLLYQWGRKDPFCINKISTNKENWNFIEGRIDLDAHAQYPMTLYSSGSGLWYNGDVNKELWKSDKTIYDPCPVGYRVPDGGSEGVWSKAFGSEGDFPAKDDTNHGYNFGGTEEGIKYLSKDTPCWYPFAGRINTLLPFFFVEDYGTAGFYWSCTTKSSDEDHKDQGIVFRNTSTKISNNLYPHIWTFSVRCQKE